MIGDGVGVVGEGEKISSNLSRKFGLRGTMTSAGAGGRLADGTSTTTDAASGTVEAQDESARTSISNVAILLSVRIGEFPLIDG